MWKSVILKKRRLKISENFSGRLLESWCIKKYLNSRGSLGGASKINIRQQMKSDINELKKLFVYLSILEKF